MAASFWQHLSDLPKAAPEGLRDLMAAETCHIAASKPYRNSEGLVLAAAIAIVATVPTATAERLRHVQLSV